VDVSKYISVVLVCLSSMIHLELPFVNVLSKIDLAAQFGDLAFRLDYYEEAMDLQYLLHHLPSDPFAEKFRSLSEGLIEVIEGYSLVSFSTLNIQDKMSVQALLKNVDRANGYAYSELPEGASLLDSVFNFGLESRAFDSSS